MQFRLTNSQRYLVNAKPGTNHSTNPILTLMVTVNGNPNPTNPTYPTNPTNPTNPTILSTVVNLSTYSAYMPPSVLPCRRS